MDEESGGHHDGENAYWPPDDGSFIAAGIDRLLWMSLLIRAVEDSRSWSDMGCGD